MLVDVERGSSVLEPQGDLPMGVSGVPSACGGLDLDSIVLEVALGDTSRPVGDNDGEEDGYGDDCGLLSPGDG
jgi:hypothetical protein